MSNTITAYFKGRVGVAESVYQNDYGIVMAFDSIDLPAHFDCYFSKLNQEEALPGLGADNRVTIPNSILANPGNVTIHIPLHTGEDDSEVEYVIYFKVIGRARPIDDGTPTQMTAIERALALLSQPITNIEEIVNEALSFTGETFDEMQADLDEWKDDTEEGLTTWKTGVESGLTTWKGGVESDIDDVEADFAVLQGQFDTAVAAVTTDTEVTDIRVGADGVTDTTAGASVRRQFSNVKGTINDYINGADRTFTITETGSHRFPMLVMKGVRYSFINKTSASCTVGYIKSDGTSVEILGALSPNIPYYFVPDSNDYVGISSWCGGTGTIEISNWFSDTATLDDITDAINDGVMPIGKLVPNVYIATNGNQTGYSGWSATDYIELGALCKVLRVTSPAASGGSYNAFYDSTKTFISAFSIASGVNDITIPDGAVYVRFSNATASISAYAIENIIGYLNRKVEELEPEPIGTPSIYEWNIDESMVVNAGANYGFHSSGQSNVQKRFSMLVTTDPHGDATAMKRAVDYLNDMPCFDCGCCLGDLQANTFSDNDGTWYTNAIKDADKPWLTLVGNHDVGIGKSIASTGNQEQVYEKFIEPNLQYAGVTPDDKSYYYKDFATYKIRLICLNPYDVDNDDTSGSEYVVPRYTEYYSQAQINWLVSVLASTPSDYHVMILTHNTPKASTKDTSVNFNNKTYSFSPESSQGGIVADIVDAWQRGTTLSHTYTCTNANLDSVTVSADFTSRGAGVLICFLTGHMHVDAIGHITSFANQNVFTLASTNTGTWQNDWSDLPRADGTKAEDCITAIAVDTTNRDIYISRIGSSVSRWFTVREPSVISY